MYIGVAPEISNRADWLMTVACNASGSDDPLDLTIQDSDLESDIRLVLRDPRSRSEVLSGSFRDGHIISGLGFFQWHFTADEMAGLCPGTYEIGITINRFGFQSQFLAGTQPVKDGIVT